jgi:predicted RND superfamily exporter protein
LEPVASPGYRRVLTAFTSWLGRTMMARRGLVVAVVLALTAAGAALALGVRADFSPERMFTDDGEQRQASADLRAHFGNTDNILLVLVRAPNVLAPEPLAYVRDLSDHLAAQGYTENVASITTVPLPRRRGPARPAGEVSLARVAGDVAMGRLVYEPIVTPGALTDDTTAAMTAALADAPLLEGQLISSDRTVTVIAVLLANDRNRVEQLRPRTSRPRSAG